MDGWRPVSFRLLREAERKGRDWALKSDSVECCRRLRRHGAAEILQVPTVESRLGGRPGAAVRSGCQIGDMSGRSGLCVGARARVAHRWLGVRIVARCIGGWQW